MAIQKAKGTEDFSQRDTETRNIVFNSFRNTARGFGYGEVSTPAFENLSLLTKKEGEEITSQIFTLEKRGSEEFGLRFDLTVPITRMFIEKQKELTKPVKWFSIDRMWRYEKPQKGRMREFYQLSVELFGADGVNSDAEIISLAIKTLTDLGLKDFVLKLNSRELLQELLLEFVPKKDLEALIRLIDKKSRISQEDFDKEVKKLKLEPKKINKIISTTLKDIKESNPKIKNEKKKLLSLIKIVGSKYIKFDLSTARGLTYYTGIVFEVFDSKEKYRSILGGGRYNNLVETLGGVGTPATGFAIGYTTLLMLLEEKGLGPKSENSLDYFIGVISDKEYKTAFKIAQKLRLKYSVEIDLAGKNISNQIKYANKINAKKLIVIGPDEKKSGYIKIKDMKTGKEKKVNISNI